MKNLENKKDRINNFFQKRIEIQNYVKSQQYLDWLILFVESLPQKGFDDYHMSYNEDKYSENDCENAQKISYFFKYVEDIGYNQSIFFDKEESLDDCMTLIFKYKTNYYELETVCGQGSITYINKLSDIPDKYINLDNINEHNELYLYVSIKKELRIENIISKVILEWESLKESLNSGKRFDKWIENGIKIEIIELNNNLEKDIIFHGIFTKKEFNV